MINSSTCTLIPMNPVYILLVNLGIAYWMVKILIKMGRQGF